MPTLATIGYESANVDDFIETLHSAEVTMLIDVRAVAVSRRKGFSKTVLASALEKAGINYVHLQGLGDPKPGRDAARSGNMEEFYSIFSEHMSTSEALLDLGKAVSYTRYYNTCLMCYEREPQNCHRKLVATEMSKVVDLKIKHLGVKVGISRTRNGHGTLLGARESPASRGARAR